MRHTRTSHRDLILCLEVEMKLLLKRCLTRHHKLAPLVLRMITAILRKMLFVLMVRLQRIRKIHHLRNNQVIAISI
uniref:Uncharacterized protein n=1 Tax=Arundo donax TaxID=35708 RepID=A0A0A9CVJ3_ARUDO